MFIVRESDSAKAANGESNPSFEVICSFKSRTNGIEQDGVAVFSGCSDLMVALLVNSMKLSLLRSVPEKNTDSSS